MTCWFFFSSDQRSFCWCFMSFYYSACPQVRYGRSTTRFYSSTGIAPSRLLLFWLDSILSSSMCDSTHVLQSFLNAMTIGSTVIRQSSINVPPSPVGFKSSYGGNNGSQFNSHVISTPEQIVGWVEIEDDIISLHLHHHRQAIAPLFFCKGIHRIVGGIIRELLFKQCWMIHKRTCGY